MSRDLPMDRSTLRVFLLWYKAAYARYLLSSLFSLTPWILFFRILGWLLLSISFSAGVTMLPGDFSAHMPQHMGLWSTFAKKLDFPQFRGVLYKSDLHWLSAQEGLKLEKSNNFKHPHPVVGDQSLGVDGKTELDGSVTHGKPPGSIPAGVIDTKVPLKKFLSSLFLRAF
jgi:hypothetical protein